MPRKVTRLARSANEPTYLTMIGPDFCGKKLPRTNLRMAASNSCPKGTKWSNTAASAIIGTKPSSVVNESAATVCA